ncbi:hypothetical protein JZX87_05095 [Agrobacterium sp. Ap1]|uniref:hypothetical protein n=1 Tax=Agrobacterium sp. Ap1 TaxID=2815337 RepID=UPI001A8E5C47|nr:hypothetical protein [Agrobacterium sp. Ap1]MBO0140544.1 hypothetical protein [Agrobacterium sp. Ap1]
MPAHSDAALMPYPEKLAQTLETSEEDFTRNYAFDMEDGLRKSVTLARTGRSLKVEIIYVDGAVVDTTTETFEADGSLRISVTENGVYLASYCALLADRVRLRRTRFF